MGRLAFEWNILEQQGERGSDGIGSCIVGWVLLEMFRKGHSACLDFLFQYPFGWTKLLPVFTFAIQNFHSISCRG